MALLHPCVSAFHICSNTNYLATTSQLASLGAAGDKDEWLGLLGSQCHLLYLWCEIIFLKFQILEQGVINYGPRAQGCKEPYDVRIFFPSFYLKHYFKKQTKQVPETDIISGPEK